MENKKFETFVLIPFSNDFEDVYEKLIKASLIEIGFEVTRADDVNSQQNILKDIISKIDKQTLSLLICQIRIQMFFMN